MAKTATTARSAASVRTDGVPSVRSRSARSRSRARRDAPSRSSLARAARKLGRETLAQVVPAGASDLLEQDHREVEAYFAQFEHDEAARPELARKICLALTVHALIEEEILYPAARNVGFDDLLNEAEVEHAAAKQLIAEIESIRTTDRLFPAKVKVLGEYVRHHVEEEETKLFPALREAEFDMREVGRRLLERRIALLAELAPRY